jgi:phospholipid/cholesterol/gamma-HCH transport system ATP-binding protein
MARSVPILEVKDLVARYGDMEVLRGVSFEADEGEILAVVGGSGCGKTTLLKYIIGLMRPTSGSVKFWGRDIAEMNEDELSALQARIGVSFQSGGLFNSMTLYDNIALPLRERRDLSEEIIDTIVRAKLALVGLDHAMYQLPSELSGGMRKRAGFARALALDPEIVFFDEPGAGLDPITAAGLDELILRLRRTLGITMVVITHELDSIKKVADRVLMLDRGNVAFLGLLDDALKSAEPRVRQFFSRLPDETITVR